MSDPLEMTKDILARPFPRSTVKQKRGSGGKNFDYITHTIITRRVIEATNNNYTFELLDTKFLTDGAAGADVMVMLVTVRLTIPGLGFRDEQGVHPIRKGGGEDQYKSAISDAFKRAAMRFGVAIDLYGEDIEGMLAEEEARRETQPDAPRQRPAAQTQPETEPSTNNPLIPADPVERYNMLREEKDRISIEVFGPYVKDNFHKDRIGLLSYEEQYQIIEWTMTQPNKHVVQQEG